MASMDADAEDIEFIDDVEDDNAPGKETQDQPCKAKRRKNQVLSEQLNVDPNDNMVKELRQDRLEKLKSEQATKETVNKNKSHVTDHAVQELLEDRRKAQMEKMLRMGNLSDNDKRPDLYTDVGPEQVELKVIDKNENVLLNFELGDTAKKEDETDEDEHGEVPEKDENAEVNTAASADDDADDNDNKESEDESESFCTMKSDLTSADSCTNDNIKTSDITKFFDCKSSPSEISILPSSDCPLEEIRENISEDTGAKPKRLANKKGDTDNPVSEDSIGSPGALKNNKDVENIGLQIHQMAAKDKDKIKEHKKNMSLDTKCLQLNGKLDKTDGRVVGKANKEIIITLTTAEGLEKDPILNDTLDQSFDDDYADNNKKSSPSDYSGNSECPLNYIRKASEESDKTTSSLVAQREMYQKSKAKPFKDLQRLKVGVIGVGIEGDRKRSYIKTIIMMPDQKLVMFDRNNKCLKLFDKDFNPLDRVHLGVRFCGLTTMQDEMIAATMPEQKVLQFYHINNVTNRIQRERTHDIEAEFYSVSHYKNKLFLLQRMRHPNFADSDEWQIVRLDLNKQKGRLKVLRTFCPGHQDCSLMANEHGVYMTNKLEGEVLHLKHDGSYRFKHKVELTLPMGLACDKYCNVYVCGGAVSSFIEICKPDIKRYKLILNKTSIDPVAMCYDKKDNFLYVCDKILGKIIKYKIEHSGFVHSLMKSFVMPGKSEKEEA